MPKKTTKKSKYDIDNEIVIGYNTRVKMDNPPKSKVQPKAKQKAKTEQKLQQKPKTKKRKVIKKKKKKINIKKILKILLKIVIIIGILVCILLFLFVSPVFNIKEISVLGAKEIPSSMYIIMSGIEKGENIFKIDKTSAIDVIKKEAYVESAKINQIYPNKIEIVIEERTVCYVVESNR